MKKGQATREAIVHEALAQAASAGFEGISLGGLAQKLELSKSGLFAHFKSKEALELAVLEEAIARFRRQVGVPAMSAPDGVPRLTALFERHLDWVRGDREVCGCIFMPLIQEYDERPGPVRDLLVSSQREWRRAIAHSVETAIRLKQFARGTDPEQFAFDMVGISLTYQMALKLLADKTARRKALASFARLLRDAGHAG